MSNVLPAIIVKDSPIHGSGGFAGTDIHTGTKLIQYIGEKISKAESLRRCESKNDYIFYLDEEFDLDGSVETNIARFLNHSCSPNCEAQRIDGQIWLVSLRDIRAGEELTFDYGYDLEFFREHPCRCGAPNCYGYVLAESLRPKL